MSRTSYRLLLFLLLVSASGFSQSLDKRLMEAKEDFAKQYYAKPFGQEESWFERLVTTNVSFFSLKNEFVLKHFAPFKRSGAYKDEEELIVAMADSINGWFMKQRLWDAVPSWWDSLMPITRTLEQQACNCVYDKNNNKDLFEVGKFQKVMSECLHSLQPDAEVAQKVKVFFAGRPTSEIIAWTKLVSQYVTITCKPFYLYLKQMSNRMAFEKFMMSIKISKNDAIDYLLRLNKENRTDSLKALFPIYKQYSNQIALLNKLCSNKQYSLSVPEKDGSRVLTYSQKIGNKRKATAQVIIGFDEKELLVVVNKLVVLERNKIPNLEKVDKELNNYEDIPEPPPPMERIN